MPSEDRVGVLREEHRQIVRRLGQIEKSLEGHGNMDQKLRRSVADLGAQLRAHFAHEESVVYRPLKSTLGEDSPTEELMEDHHTIWTAFTSFREMSSGKGDGEVPGESLRGTMALLRSTLNRHLEKEEKVVFWLADYHLGR